jgi:hypothetical protein
MPAAPSAGDTALRDAAPRATVRRLVGRRVVAYHPSFAAGLFLAQLFYWHDRGSDPDGWIYKTQAEWEEETGLSRWEQETARRRLRERGLVEEKLADLPARLHYRLDVERLTALLSARVKRTPSPSSGEGNGRRPRTAAQPVVAPRASARGCHNQACGVTTNKDVGKPQTSLRGCHTHAETTIEHSRERGTERLAGSLLKPSPAGSCETSSASSDAGSSASSLDEPSGDAPIGPSVDEYPSEVICSLHGAPMRLREKDGDRWYSHRLGDGSWCKGAPGDQPDAGPDPRSIESRREYLAWADPACDPGSAASRREYLAWLDPGAHMELGGGDRRVDRGAVRANACCANAYRASTYGDKRTAPRTSPVASTARAANTSSPDRGGGRAPPSRPVTPRHADGAVPSTDPAPDATAHRGADPPAPGLARDIVQRVARRLAHRVAYQAAAPTSDPAGGSAPRASPAGPGYSVTPSACAGPAPAPVSRGRSPPASGAPHVAFVNDVGIRVRQDSVRGPPSPAARWRRPGRARSAATNVSCSK